jgi:hypothetical protein
MRAMFLVVGSILLCAGPFGCDNRPQATVSAPVAVTVPQACNCAPPAPPSAPVVQIARSERRHTRHHRHTVAEFERMYPGYGESDRSYSSQDEAGDDSSSQETMTQDDDAGPMRKPAWVDGYGRAHYASDDAEQDENPAHLSRETRRMRRDPYRGWNSDCDAIN